MANVSRRTMIKTIGAAMLTAGLPPEGATAKARTTRTPAATPSAGAAGPPITYLFFSREEAAFIEAAVSRLIPADEHGSSRSRASSATLSMAATVTWWGGA